jgi:hypothetical protein
MLRFALSATGGLSYHLIARRRARSSWAPFRTSVREWLAPWLARIGEGELIVFGPSAGWTLPLDLFAGFSRILFVEPDPIARFLLRRRLPPGMRCEFIARADLLPWTSSHPGVFADLLARHPGAAVLFTNVLGQVPLIAKRTDFAARDEFLQALSSREWASYHDLYSGPAKDARLLPSHTPSDVFKDGLVIDHETAWLSNRSSQLALWPLTEDSLHVIEFVTGSVTAHDTSSIEAGN